MFQRTSDYTFFFKRKIKHLGGRHNQLDHGRRTGGIDMQSAYNGLPNLSAKAAYLNYQGKAWRKNLSGDEEEAIGEYSGHAYADINDALRSGHPLDDEYDVYRDALDGALQRSSAPADMIVYRGLSKKMLPNLKIGGLVSDKAFVSTSIDEEEARKGFGIGKILATISIPKGSSGAYIASLSPNPDEREWLLPRNATFKVLSLPHEGELKTAEVSLLYMGSEEQKQYILLQSKAILKQDYFNWNEGDLSF